ncbi:TetR family transcriptional regulator [Sulfitobacter sp. HNIBRBA3233]|uniref:TetR/AcrR family transcriptional regulator n=1 Tax=Sulfitobacter marinivivus TaxID=3158558 RepID=UPI0032DF4A42
MTKPLTTRDKLLTEARRLLWARGYSAVSLRQITTAAGVDVALVSRYFGSKQGLFEATLDGAFDVPEVADESELLEMVVHMFVSAPRGGEMPSMLQLMLMNAHDPEVGDRVRAAQIAGMQDKLTATLGGDARRAALFMSAVLGMSVAEKSLHLPGIPPHDTPEYEAQLRHLLSCALAWRPAAR